MALQEGNDPRVVRTRLLIQEALLSLAQHKEFESISVKDIAETASINRATFYAHYVDKYALLDEMLSERFTALVHERIPADQPFNEAAARQLIALLCDFQILFYKECKIASRSIAAVVETKVQHELQQILANLLHKEYQSKKADNIQLSAHIIGSSLYSGTRYWFNNQQSQHADALLDDLLVFTMSGITALHGEPQC
ncbi:TetR/AcrR family transcriptional regulator [Paenibacillus glycanilyticus]|uniref:TetR/AcrR family transcriptional regulator n=1 Tax=Paenibacillus glycanilyticus TaxID=126569 RepID=A0ABQ6GHW2_9BACL|nr:TetR/AcrR family transcriptional regulator [Paenibacillus glycanilyticus]GLX69700.1 TetR/AcrR family transcriptional regulator [Paenibacillus glycanilyticus]